MDAMIRRWVLSLPPVRTQPHKGSESPSTSSRVVLLTGTTGTLGAAFLDALVHDPRIGHIYTLNRRPAVVDRQRSALAHRRLDPEIMTSSKITSLQGDVSQAGLGLDPPVLEKLKRSVTHIVHNAWLVNLTAPLSEFESYIQGTCELLKLAALASEAAQLIYISSISITLSWNLDKRGDLAPEEALQFPEAPGSIGYTQSKYVMENILSKAATMGHRVSVLRLEQICGSVGTGIWFTSEWVPVMVKTSLALGCLPFAHSLIFWLPDDVMNGALLDCITTSEDLPGLMTCAHPRPSAWGQVFNAIGAALGGIPVVPMQDWMAKLEALSEHAKGDDYKRAPALKILPFFRLFAEFIQQGSPSKHLWYATEKAQKFSATLRNAQPLTYEHACAWVEYWEREGFIQRNSQPRAQYHSKL